MSLSHSNSGVWRAAGWTSLSAGFPPLSRHAAERWQQRADVCVAAAFVSASSRLQQTSYTLLVFINTCSPACAFPLCIWFMYQTETMDGCTFGIPLLFCLFSDVCDAWSLPCGGETILWLSRNYPGSSFILMEVESEAVSDPHQETQPLHTVHAVLTGSSVCTDEPEQPVKQQQLCLFLKWSVLYVCCFTFCKMLLNPLIMAVQHSTGLTEKKLTRIKWPQFVSLWF